MPKRPPKTPQNATPALGRTNIEQTMREIVKSLESQEFASVDEANAYLSTLIGGRPKPAVREALSAREEAQELAYDAMEAATEAQARKLAKRALAKDPDCVDALVVLTGVEATSPKRAIVGLQKAVAAGERFLGAKFFRENKGFFWGILETRPYMRARQQLAEMLSAAGLEQDAIAHYQAMLELNPNDNQGVRDPLLGLYLAVGDLTGAGELLKKYKDDGSATFAWGRVLERRLSGDPEGAAQALKIARKQNRFVERYLSGQERLPESFPDSYTMGSVEEARISLESLGSAWAAHPETIVWLVEQLLRDESKKAVSRGGRAEKRSPVE